jgi:hypothetical protein
MSDYDHAVAMAAASLGKPELVPQFRQWVERAVDLRGGFVEGRYVDRSIMKSVMAAIVERAPQLPEAALQKIRAQIEDA